MSGGGRRRCEETEGSAMKRFLEAAEANPSAGKEPSNTHAPNSKENKKKKKKRKQEEERLEAEEETEEPRGFF